MKKKRISLLLAITLVGGTVLATCGNGDNSEQSADGVTTVEFWATPNPPQQAFWQEMAKEYETVNPKVKVNVSAIKESPSSEASIQVAIAGGNAPTVAENINRGFLCSTVKQQSAPASRRTAAVRRDGKIPEHDRNHCAVGIRGWSSICIADLFKPDAYRMAYRLPERDRIQ